MEGPTSVDELAVGVLDADRTSLGRAITLVESRNPEHRDEADELIARLLPRAGGGHRVGVTGVPGSGKSTLIETLGTQLTGVGQRVAVLAVDPTSSRTGGSILGDKTRMTTLANDPNAFIRPSPSSGALGGVTRTTREVITVLEAAGFDVVIVETVGVGQSETLVAEMVDFFLVLVLAGAGDELQGIKKGVLELADMIAVNKADGDNLGPAKTAARDLATAVHLMTPATPTWTPPVVTCSALHDEGVDSLWALIEEHRDRLVATGEWETNRQRQLVAWMWQMVDDQLRDNVRRHPSVIAARPELEAAVRGGAMPAPVAAETILDAAGDTGQDRDRPPQTS